MYVHLLTCSVFAEMRASQNFYPNRCGNCEGIGEVPGIVSSRFPIISPCEFCLLNEKCPRCNAAMKSTHQIIAGLKSLKWNELRKYFSRAKPAHCFQCNWELLSIKKSSKCSCLKERITEYMTLLAKSAMLCGTNKFVYKNQLNIPALIQATQISLGGQGWLTDTSHVSWTVATRVSAMVPIWYLAMKKSSQQIEVKEGN